MKYFFVFGVFCFYFVSGKIISEHCKHDNGVLVTCKCTSNDEFYLPSNFNYENLTFLKISSCKSATINLKNQPNAKLVRNIEIQNISELLIFQPTFMSKNVGIIELKNIGKILNINHDIFSNILTIDLLKIENSRIINFDEQFTNLNIRNLIFKNVTIDNMIGINFSGNADTLKITDTIIRNIKENINFAFFTTIELTNSTFEFNKSSDMWIQGKTSKINNCIFSNVSINIVSRQRIIMKNNCADGKSSLRLSSMSTNSCGNKLPTEIIYTENKSTAYYLRIINNTVCIAGNCKCPKSVGNYSGSNIIFNNIHGIFIIVIILRYVL